MKRSKQCLGHAVFIHLSIGQRQNKWLWLVKWKSWLRHCEETFNMVRVCVEGGFTVPLFLKKKKKKIWNLSASFYSNFILFSSFICGGPCHLSSLNKCRGTLFSSESSLFTYLWKTQVFLILYYYLINIVNINISVWIPLCNLNFETKKQ